ncbi:DUF4381 domain-containing protein [Aquabacter sediminis]|uniref:DUF4381 domain-containing protein n=1 Tax=Aquabacter sediminis TaxID=3029197 RepID=UPI00237ED0E0|nr:DUF4381 domain-containing protein [Aquabacter sp. P-9]MDE1570223.1 DUF4381 domain-containing protein [Aquabacter sp. P-9]
MNPQQPYSLPPSPLDPPGQELLAQLRGLHLPGEVPFWPLAPGWWMLAGALVVVLLIALYLEWRRRQTLSYKVRQQVKAIAADLKAHPDARSVAAASAILLRRVVVSRGRDEAAVTFTGPAWEEVLATGKGGMGGEVARFVALAPYVPPHAPGGDGVPRAALVAALCHWIKVNAK